MQTLATLTFECDITITEESTDQFIHPWFLELASCPRPAIERRWALDVVSQELGDI